MEAEETEAPNPELGAEASGQIEADETTAEPESDNENDALSQELNDLVAQFQNATPQEQRELLRGLLTEREEMSGLRLYAEDELNGARRDLEAVNRLLEAQRNANGPLRETIGASRIAIARQTSAMEVFEYLAHALEDRPTLMTVSVGETSYHFGGVSVIHKTAENAQDEVLSISRVDRPSVKLIIESQPRTGGTARPSRMFTNAQLDDAVSQIQGFNASLQAEQEAKS